MSRALIYDMPVGAYEWCRNKSYYVKRDDGEEGTYGHRGRTIMVTDSAVDPR